MKRLYAILLCITILFAICVETSAFYSDDILKENVEKENEVEEKEEEKMEGEKVEENKEEEKLEENKEKEKLEENKEEEKENSIDSTPEPTNIPDNNVSWSSVSENLINIENELRGLREDVQNITDTTISVSVSNINDFNDKDVTVSNNLINKPLSEYNTSESISLITLMLGFAGLLVYIVHKSIYRWKR